MEKIGEEHLKSGSTDIKQWFLTNDRSLMRYELSVGKKKRNYYSHCIFPEHLLQILRPLLPRSADFQQSLIEFISGRQQFGMSFMSSPSVAYNILARLDRYKTRPKEVAIKVLTDVHFNHHIKSIKDKEQRDEEIDSELLKQADIAIKEKEVAVKMAKQVGGHRDRLEKENQELRGFKKEIEEGRKRRNKVLAWTLFVVIGVGSFVGLLYLISKSAILLDVKGTAFVFLVFIALLIWLVILLVVARVIPGHESLREDIKSVLGVAKKVNDLFKNN